MSENLFIVFRKQVHLFIQTHGLARLISALLLMHAMLFPVYAAPPKKDILFLKSSNAAVYDEVIENYSRHLNILCSRLKKECYLPDIHRLVQNGGKIDHTQTGLVIALGLKARDYAAKHLQDANLVNAMIPEESLADQGSTETPQKAPTLLLDQPVCRSLRLIKQIMPSTQRVGLMLSDSHIDRLLHISQEANKLDLTLVTATVKDEAEIGRKLGVLLDDIDVMLALPDTKIHNRKTVSNILLTSYRKKIPLIGFSAAYVRAGALAAVYSSPEDIGRQLAEISVKIDEPDFQPPLRAHPIHFSVSVNEQVARSLGITLPKAAAIKAKLLEEQE